MKTINIFILFTLCLLSACTEYEVENAFSMVNPIVFEYDGRDGNSIIPISGKAFDVLKLEPLVYKEGTDDENLSFLWTISGVGIVTQEVGKGRALNLTLSFPPQILTYNLVYSITDNVTGIQRHVKFVLKVDPAFTEGLIIADTKDGISSDLHLAMYPQFTTKIQYGDERLVNNIYSLNNGSTIDGLAVGIQTKSFQTNRNFTVITPNSVIRGDHYDYFVKQEECNGGAFLITPDKIEPTQLFLEADTGNEYILCDGKLYHRTYQNNNKKFGYYIYPPGYTDYFISKGFTVYGGPRLYYKSYFWDINREGFLLSNMGKLTIPDAPQSGDAPFNLQKMEGMEPVYFGHANSTLEVHLLMREKATGKIRDYVVNSIPYLTENGANAPKTIIDIINAPNFDKAISYTSSSNEGRIYYTDGATIYAYSLTTLAEKPVYSLIDGDNTEFIGDKITKISVCDFANGQIRYKDLSGSSSTGYRSMNAKNRLMIVTTHNETTGEGKIIMIPMPYTNGDFETDRNFHTILKGFGRILCYNRNNG
ncbi:MAG: hypothetical protein ACRDDZ_03450 [Marinifilaceae bacterium]